MKQRLGKSFAIFIFVAMMSATFPRPAHAQELTHDIIGDVQAVLTQINTYATAANTYISTTLESTMVVNQQLAAVWQQVSDAVGKALQSQAAARIADAQSQNHSVMVDKKTAQDIERQLHTPSQQSACAVAQATRARSEMRGQAGAAARGLAQGGGGRPADPSAVAQDIHARALSGLAPCNAPGATTQDTETATYQALGCQVKYNHKYEKADTTPTIFEQLQFPVPDNFVPPANGIPMPIQSVSQEKYMPFLAAYSFCQSLAPRLPAAPQTVQGHVTVDSAGIDAHTAMITTSNMAYGKCMRLIAERMQYGSELTNAAFQAAHLSQVTACKADAQVGIVDGPDPTETFSDGTTAPCSSAGRSLLQAEWDRANRDGALAYHSIYLQGVTPDERVADRRGIGQEKQALQDLIERELDGLATAYLASHQTPVSRPNTLSAPISPAGGGGP